MSLNRRVALIVIAIFVLSGVISMAIQQLVIMPSFQTLEEETAHTNTQRALEAIQRELTAMSPILGDWAWWDDTYAYAQESNVEYVEENLYDETLIGLQVNFLGLYDASGKPLWTMTLDLDSSEPLDLDPFGADGLDKDHPLRQQQGLKGAVMGILQTPIAPMLVVAKSILTNKMQGPPAGTFILGRFLNPAVLEQINIQIQLPLKIIPVSESATATWAGNSLRGLNRSPIELARMPEVWEGRALLADLFNRPILEVRVDTPRDITAQGAQAMAVSRWSLVATGLLMMAVLWLALRQAVLGPLARLTDHAVTVGETDGVSRHLASDRNDEVGVLTRSFNDMVDRLADTRRRLVDQSFHAGIAEMASGVLHNIGNAITPLNVKLSGLSTELGAAPTAELRQAATELADPSTPMERREDLAQFMQLAGVEVADLVVRSHEKVGEAAHQLQIVQEILADQQRYSRSARVIEPVRMADAIRDAEKGLSSDMSTAMRVEVDASVVEVGIVLGARAALQQVVTNVLVNAAESILAAGGGDGRLSVSAVLESSTDTPVVHLRFVDNGPGMSPENVGKAFERGFSTKGRNNSGLGLHWSANTVLGLGGRISAENLESGEGFCLHILLPAASA